MACSVEVDIEVLRQLWKIPFLDKEGWFEAAIPQPVQDRYRFDEVPVNLLREMVDDIAFGLNALGRRLRLPVFLR